MILQSLAGLPAFLVYFCTGLIAIVAYLFVYTRITPHNEFQLIRDNDPAAAIALGLSLLGFVAPLFSAIAHAANVLDCLIWAFIALIVQVAVFYIVKIPVPNLSGRIARGFCRTRFCEKYDALSLALEMNELRFRLLTQMRQPTAMVCWGDFLPAPFLALVLCASECGSRQLCVLLGRSCPAR